jgi:beta-lactamase class A
MVSIPNPATADDHPSGRFLDDDRHPAEVSFEWLAEPDLIHGCNPPANTEICPDRHITRAETAKLLWQVASYREAVGPVTAGPDRFGDDDDSLGGRGEAFIESLAALGIVHGCDPPANTRFCPDDPIRRGAAAKILVGLFGLEAPPDHAAPWPDIAGEYYAEQARIASYHGLWQERSSFDGAEVITRGELMATTLEAAGVRLCRPGPFTQARVADLEDSYPSQLITAHVLDLSTGCHYRLNHDNRQRTASVFKVMVMAGTMVEAQRDDRAVSEWELSQLEPMITESADPPVRALWSSFGASPWFARQVERFGLTETVAAGDDGSPWGVTTTSAADQVDLLRQVLLGQWGPVEPDNRQLAVELMTSVVESQTWGVTAGVPAGWVVAQKNGFAGITINSVGWVDEPGDPPGYLVAILSQGWPDHPSGIAAVERVNEWVAEAMTTEFSPSS